jgi:ubiquinone/menaquinone biosynthesis C-methylase UbiE
VAVDQPVNYDAIAPNYHQRYAFSLLPGVASTIAALVRERQIRRALEVGCGTGRWLTELREAGVEAVGLDLSTGMLRQARQRDPRVVIACGRAGQFPFPDAAFDLILCVNAFHHFEQPARVIAEARRLLNPEGALAIVGLNPHSGRDRWFIYDYFEGTQAADVRRYPSPGFILDWMIGSGFGQVRWQKVERIQHVHTGREILSDHFVQKHGTSQLALLSDEAYEAGLNRIRDAIAQAERSGEPIEFRVDITLEMVVGLCR